MTIELAIKESDADWHSLKAFLSSVGYGGVSAHVDARDEMYAHGLAVCPIRSIARHGYLRAGLQSHATLKQILRWKFGDDGSRKAFLDFAAGYGRATRFMRTDFPHFDIAASDILPGAMEFQAEYLGIRTILSTTKPDDFVPSQQFDFIWVASLFTHLPERTFHSWLKRLYELLTPNGMLAFSTHPTHLMPPGVEMPASGLLFQPLSEIPTLETSDYGATIATPDFVAGAIQSATGRSEFRRIERALSWTQDVYVVSKSTPPDRPLTFLHSPYGALDSCIWINDDTLLLSGWALDYTEGHKIRSVDFYLNDKLIGSAMPTQSRPDLVNHSEQFVGKDRAPRFLMCGWTVRLAVTDKIRPFSDILIAKAVSTSGMEFGIRGCALNTLLTIGGRY